MLTRIFGKINSSTTIYIGLMAVVMAVGFFMGHFRIDFFIKTAWGNVPLKPYIGYIVFSVAFSALLFGAQWLIVEHYKLLKRHAYLPFFLGVFILLYLPQGNLNLLFQSLFFMLILASWLAVFQGEKLLTRTLNMGIFIGLASLLDPHMGLLVLLSFIIYVLFGRLNMRTFFILLIGFFSVWLNALAIEYLLFSTAKATPFFFDTFAQTGLLHMQNIAHWHWILLLVILPPALFEFANTVSRASVFKRQANSALVIVVALIGASALLFGTEVFQLAIILPALLILFVNFFQYIKKTWVQEVLLWMALAILAGFIFGLL